MLISKSWTDTKLNITWVTLTGNHNELDRAAQWTEKNKTAWVMNGKRVSLTMGEFLQEYRVNTSSHAKVLKDGLWPYRQNIGFKNVSDLLRFKLSMA